MSEDNYRNSLKYVTDTVDQEGFDYAFTGYSEFKEVKDEKFHELRRDYLKAADELASYLGVDI